MDLFSNIDSMYHTKCPRNNINSANSDYFTIQGQTPQFPTFKRIDHTGNYLDAFDAYLQRVLICTLCNNTLEEPVTDSCGHTFCAECILKARQFGNVCPITGFKL